MISAGIKGTKTVVVTEENTARVVKSGTLPVFATPALAALIEETAWKSVAEKLQKGEATVGGSLNLKHLAPTPVGGVVTCRTELTEAAGKKLVFHAEVEDESGIIGEAEHVRFVIQEDAFMEKADKRRKDA